MKTWSKNLNDVPSIENYDIMLLYLYKSCQWNELTKSDDTNHIIDVEVCQDPDTTYRFIN